jgi:hypothetical protein
MMGLSEEAWVWPGIPLNIADMARTVRRYLRAGLGRWIPIALELMTFRGSWLISWGFVPLFWYLTLTCGGRAGLVGHVIASLMPFMSFSPGSSHTLWSGAMRQSDDHWEGGYLVRARLLEGCWDGKICMLLGRHSAF